MDHFEYLNIIILWYMSRKNLYSYNLDTFCTKNKASTTPRRNVFFQSTSKVNWEVAALQSNWFQDGFRCRTDSIRCFMIRNWTEWYFKNWWLKNVWIDGCSSWCYWMLGWLGFDSIKFLGNEVAGRSTFAAIQAMKYFHAMKLCAILFGNGPQKNIHPVVFLWLKMTSDSTFLGWLVRL